MELPAVLEIVRDITVSGLLVAGIWGLVTGKVVTRFHYDEMRQVLEQRIAIQTTVIQRLRDGDRAD